MDAFRVPKQLIRDYRSFSEGFTDIRDERIARHVAEQAHKGRQWPEPWLALNPSFATGGGIDELVAAGTLHPQCARIFRVGKQDTGESGRPMVLHRHQAEAIETARTGTSYVLTTGTGSGKSLGYLVPIVDAVLREGSRRGIRAIVIYPMNALANSQVEELGKFLGSDPETQPVTSCPLHRAGGRGDPQAHPGQPAGCPADQLRDAVAWQHLTAKGLIPLAASGSG